MHPWMGQLILYSVPILLMLGGLSGVFLGVLPFGDESTRGMRARFLGAALILMGLFIGYVIRILTRGYI